MDTELPPILILEDDADDLFIITHRLRKAGIRNPVETFNDCASLIRFLSHGSVCQSHGSPVLLLDLNLPLVDGFEMLRWIRDCKATRNFRVAVLTGSFRTADETRARDMGADAYFQKHPHRDRLARFIQQPD